MALKIVNTAPGTDGSSFKPGSPMVAGLRSESDTVEPSTVQAFVGLSGLRRESVIPEDSAWMVANAMEILRETSERRRPLAGACAVDIINDSLIMRKTSDSVGETCIYNITVPISAGDPVLGYFKLRTKNMWAQFTPDWCPLTGMTGVTLGVEHGTFNTSCSVFLRATGAGHGSLVVGGPVQALGASRPGQQELSEFDWAALPHNTAIELWVYFNTLGMPPPFSPHSTPLVEVWARGPGEAAPTVLLRIPVGMLEQFPGRASTFSNFRDGVRESATIFFGIPGHAGDVLQLDDWALFPDFRRAMVGGVAAPGHSRVFVPDSPLIYASAEGMLPALASPSRWLPLQDGSAPEWCRFKYHPGRPTIPFSVLMDKTSNGMFGFEREEPRIATRADGFMVEAQLAAHPTASTTGNILDPGFCVEDERRRYHVVMVDTGAMRTVGLLKSDGYLGDMDSVYLADREIDWTSPKMVRLDVDRVRGEASLTVDGVLCGAWPLTGEFPLRRVDHGRVSFGHLLGHSVFRGNLEVARLLYASRFSAWESRDGVIPGAPFSPVASGSGSSTMVGGALEIAKTNHQEYDSHQLFSRDADLADTQGCIVEAVVAVPSFVGANGISGQANSDTGVCLRVNFGNKSLTLAFALSGLGNRVVGVIPGSGSINDITEQTLLGRAFSASADWREPINYRVVYRAYRAIEVWVGSTAIAPAITIPWRNDTDGFDIPERLTVPSLEFGHVNSETASVSRWSAVRLGTGHGYDLSVTQSYPNELRWWHFRGKANFLLEFDE